MSKIIDRVVAEWTKTWREENLSPETETLIAQANVDLYNGPHSEEGYPGFGPACQAIRGALSALPGTLYVDEQSEYAAESEPCAERCAECADAGEDADACAICDGNGWIGPGEYYTIDRETLARAIVGRELCAYVR